MNVVNVTIEWYTKSGVQQNTQSLKSFFGSSTFTFDPKVIYDQYAERFVVVTLEAVDNGTCSGSNVSNILVAVSRTSNPNSGWWFTSINGREVVGSPCTNDYWADYPGFAVGQNEVYITANLFGFDGSRSGLYLGGRLWIIEKGIAGGFYAGGPVSQNKYDPISAAPGAFAMTVQPAHMFGTPQTTLGGLPVGTFLLGYSGLSDTVNEYLQVIRVDDPLGGSGGPFFILLPFVNSGDIDNTAAAMPDARQNTAPPGHPIPGRDIETNDRRALNAVWRSYIYNAETFQSLWTTAQVVPGSGQDAEEGTVHWWELETTNLAAISLTQQGDVGGDDVADATYTFMPSIMVDKNGCAAIGFAASASSMWSGAYYTARNVTDPPGTMQPVAALPAGTDYYVCYFSGSQNRWGDYSGIALDPLDEETFWVYNEYAVTRGTGTGAPLQDGRWGTRYGTVNPCCADLYWYRDADGDGFGDPSSFLHQCAQPAGPPYYVLDNTDYDDSDPNIYPGGPPARIDGITPAYYWTLQDVYDAASDGDVIQCLDTTFTENLLMDIYKSITLEGGYDGIHSTQSGYTTLDGTMTFEGGPVEMDKIIVK